MEALSCSIPVICSKIPGNTEIINNNNGYILDKFDDKNYDLISKKILYDYINKQPYYKKRRESFKSVVDKISRRKNQLELKKILYNFMK
jgi:glycosyltransferase involved in cell wall biosynthesis